MQPVKQMIIEALDYAGARTAAGDFSDGGIFAMAYRELINSIRNINAEPRYTFGYEIHKGYATRTTLEIGNMTSWALSTESEEILLAENGEPLEGDFVGGLDPEASVGHNLDFGVLVPYRIARVFDGIGEFERVDRADVIRDRDLHWQQGRRQFSFNQDREDFAILELSHLPSGEITVIAEKQIVEPKDYEDYLDLPRNVYKFLMSWLSRSVSRRLGNVEMEALAAAELASNEKPFIATNERNKRDYRLNPRRAYARLGAW